MPLPPSTRYSNSEGFSQSYYDRNHTFGSSQDRRNPSRGYADAERPLYIRPYPHLPPLPTPPIPPQRDYRPYYSTRDVSPPRTSMRESIRDSMRDSPRDSQRNADRRSRGYYPPTPSEPREHRHRSSRRESPERRPRHASVEPKNRSSRGHDYWIGGDTRSSRLPRERVSSPPPRQLPRSRSVAGPRDGGRRDERERRHRSRPRDNDFSSRDMDRERERDRGHDRGGGHSKSSLKRHGTMPAAPSSGSKARGSKDSFWKNPAVQAGCRSAFTSGFQAVMQNSREPGPWIGKKGVNVAVAAVTAGVTDGLASAGKKKGR